MFKYCTVHRDELGGSPPSTVGNACNYSARDHLYKWSLYLAAKSCSCCSYLAPKCYIYLPPSRNDKSCHSNYNTLVILRESPRGHQKWRPGGTAGIKSPAPLRLLNYFILSYLIWHVTVLLTAIITVTAALSIFYARMRAELVWQRWRTITYWSTSPISDFPPIIIHRG